jgi:hypothetical protein
MAAGPFRIEKPADIQQWNVPADGEPPPAPQQGNQLKDYMSRLITLIPGEAIGVYLTLRGFWVGGEPGAQSPLVGYLPLLGLALVVFVRIWGTRDSAIGASSTQWLGTGIAAVAFVLWVLGMGHSVLWFAPVDGKITSTLIVLFSFVVPYFYKGE